MKSLIFLLLLGSVQVYAKYILSPDINSIELKLAIKHLEEQKQDEILSRHAGDLNRWSETIEITNLELIIKTEFYKSFLNDSPEIEGIKSYSLSKKVIELVRTELAEPTTTEFAHWFLDNLLQDYSKSTASQKKYITPWLISFTQLSLASWHKLLNKSILNYFNNLAAHLQMIQKFARSDRTASTKVGRKTLIDWEQDELTDSPTATKSEAIDLIDKNLPKAP